MMNGGSDGMAPPAEETEETYSKEENCIYLNEGTLADVEDGAEVEARVTGTIVTDEEGNRKLEVTMVNDEPVANELEPMEDVEARLDESLGNLAEERKYKPSI